MIKQARFILANLMTSESALRTHLAACFYSTAILNKCFLTGVSMAIRGGRGGDFFEVFSPHKFMKKKCTKCKEEKFLAEFIKSGLQRHSMCDPCRKEYLKKQNRKRAKLLKEKLW